jgi:hypothetical protein
MEVMVDMEKDTVVMEVMVDMEKDTVVMENKLIKKYLK